MERQENKYTITHLNILSGIRLQQASCFSWINRVFRTIKLFYENMASSN